MKFVILGHLMGGEQLKKFFPLGRYLPLKLMEAVTASLPAKKSFIVASHFHIFDKAEGWLVGLTLTPQQVKNLSKERVRKKILEAVFFSQEKLGAELLMLGALTSPLTSAGLWLTENPKVKLKITNGNTYTAVISIEAVEEAVRLADLNLSQITIAIVGAAGVIGEAITKHFSQKDVHLILVGRTMEKLERLKSSLTGQNYVITNDLTKIIQADIVVTATSHPTALIRPEILKKNAIVVDVAEPSDVPSNIAEMRPDVICIDGGRVKTEGVDLKMNLGLPKDVSFACMAEVILQALEEEKKNYVGSVDLSHIEETQKWAEKWGFELADFTSFNQPVSVVRFKKLKGN
jgi:fatty aldehyde-generating acyl-ACP reductase